jgi:hypothetical protein
MGGWVMELEVGGQMEDGGLEERLEYFEVRMGKNGVF